MEKEVISSQEGYIIDGVGQVQIAEEVVAIIAAIAATEVDGVNRMYGHITSDIAGKLGMKRLSKGVKIEIENGEVSVRVKLVVDFGVNIAKVSQEVQERVSTAIETMTGLKVTVVNIRIAGIQTA